MHPALSMQSYFQRYCFRNQFSIQRTTSKQKNKKTKKKWKTSLFVSASSFLTNIQTCLKIKRLVYILVTSLYRRCWKVSWLLRGTSSSGCHGVFETRPKKSPTKKTKSNKGIYRVTFPYIALRRIFKRTTFGCVMSGGIKPGSIESGGAKANQLHRVTFHCTTAVYVLIEWQTKLL